MKSKKFPDDPIVSEVRRARERYAAKFNYDLDAIFDDVQRRQDASPKKLIRSHRKAHKKAG